MTTEPTLPLSREEVEALPDGVPIIVTWSGGNGPHRYTTHRDAWGLVAATDWEVEHGRFDPVKALDGPGAFVGTERMHTRVWLAEPSNDD